MNNIDHAFENAIYSVLNGTSYEQWREMEQKRNLPYVNATAEEIWSIANYIVYTPEILDDIAEKQGKFIYEC